MIMCFPTEIGFKKIQDDCIFVWQLNYIGNAVIMYGYCIFIYIFTYSHNLYLTKLSLSYLEIDWVCDYICGYEPKYFSLIAVSLNLYHQHGTESYCNRFEPPNTDFRSTHKRSNNALLYKPEEDANANSCKLRPIWL